MGNFCSDNDLADLRDGIAESMSRGLHTKDASTIKMLPSFVENLPSKDGNSTYVALDLGGTNFRVLLINIVDDNIDMDSQIYSVPQRNRSKNLLFSPIPCVFLEIHGGIWLILIVEKYNARSRSRLIRFNC